MLVLTRKAGESLLIGGKTKVVVVEAKGGSVKLGIEAPSNVLVYRGEVYDRIMEENKSAAKMKIDDLSSLASLLPIAAAKKKEG